jgi:hypothetical protein
MLVDTNTRPLTGTGSTFGANFTVIGTGPSLAKRGLPRWLQPKTLNETQKTRIKPQKTRIKPQKTRMKPTKLKA